MPMISLRKYARERGISHTAVEVAIRSGRLSKSIAHDAKGRPKIADADLADKEWAANTDQSAPRNRITGDPKRRKATASAPYEPKSAPAAAAPVVPAADAGGGDGSGGPSYAKSRAVREHYQARLAKLEFDEKAGKLVPVDSVRVAIFNTARASRDMLMAIPDRVTPLVVGLTDAHEIHRILTDEVRRVCVEVSKTKLPEKTDA